MTKSRGQRGRPGELTEGTVCGRWTVIGPLVRRGGNNDAFFPCRCSCGTERSVIFRVLREAAAGKVVGSCGCAHAEAMASKRTYGSLQPGTREYERARWLRTRHGITPEDWDAMWDDQSGHCPICERELDRAELRVDHDHQTGAIRGLLCHHCNVGLGHFEDDVERLRRAVAYLQQTQDTATKE